MIIGNGDIASILPDRRDLLFFASGVSNSQETKESEYQREKELLLRQPVTDHIVYFSSLSIFYANSRYTKHKREMEMIIKDRFPLYTIIRLGNITWGKNPHTLINHFKRQILKGEILKIQPTYRYIIERDEFLDWISMIPTWSCEMNLPGKRMTVEEVVSTYCKGYEMTYGHA